MEPSRRHALRARRPAAEHRRLSASASSQVAVWVVRAGLAAVAALILLNAAAFLLQRRLIYLPDTGPVPPAHDVLRGAQDVRLVTSDGVPLGAWYVPVPGSDLAVLVCNGNAGNRAHRAPLAEALARRGFSVLLFDYRGYGGNPGRPSEEGLVRDAAAARSWLGRRHARVAYLGESLGAGVAVALAAEHAPEALVLRSPFPSLAAVGRIHYPLLLVSVLLRDRFAVAERLEAVRAPVLVVAGDRDGIVPLRLSREVAEAADPDADLVVVEGAGHNDAALLAGEAFVDAIEGFLRSLR